MPAFTKWFMNCVLTFLSIIWSVLLIQGSFVMIGGRFAAGLGFVIESFIVLGFAAGFLGMATIGILANKENETYLHEWLERRLQPE